MSSAAPHPIPAPNVAAEVARWLGEITQGFKWTPSTPVAHSGVDFGLSYGTPIQNPIGGTLLDQSFQPWGGQEDILVNLPGVGTAVESFLHLSQLSTFAPGAAVPAGAFIGDSGTPVSAQYGTTYGNGPHLHYELTAGPLAPYVSSYSPSKDPTAADHPLDPLPFLQALVSGGGGSSSSSGAGSSVSPSALLSGLGAPLSSTSAASNTCSNDTPGVGWIGTGFCNLGNTAQDLFSSVLAVVVRGGVIVAGAAIIILAIVLLFRESGAPTTTIKPIPIPA